MLHSSSSSSPRRLLLFFYSGLPPDYTRSWLWIGSALSLSLSRWPWNRKLPSCYLSWWKRLSPARTADRGRLNALTHKIKKKKEIRKANSLIEMLVSMYGVSVYHICVCWVQIRNAALSLFIPTQGSIMRAIYMRPCGQQHTLTHTTRDCVLWCESEGEKESRKNRRKKEKKTGHWIQFSAEY